ncbi:FADR059Cp [Eremothecium gossypii FDAG1]|nr:FADR059Cp [Eremothecium gossypii FDAG1]
MGSLSDISFFDHLQELARRDCCVNALLWCAFTVGAVKLTTFMLSLISIALETTVLPSASYKKYGARKGAYALVTGASDGIGKEFALQLASKGFNVLLVSRTEAKLLELKQEIMAKYKVDARVLSVDFGVDNRLTYTAISELCGELPVTVLVNNVGVSHSIPVPFLETTEEELRGIITVNNTATLMVTQTVAPLVIANARRLQCRGLVLTMGSFGGLLPTPLLATYSGSKAFLQAWSAALAGELAPHNVDVQIVLSYLVTSAMSKVRRASALIPTPRAFVRSTLASLGRRVGAQDRYATCTPYWSHALYHFLIENTVGVHSRLANAINYRFHADIRKRALRKAARKAAEKQE